MYDIMSWYGLGLTPQEDFHDPTKRLTKRAYPWHKTRGSTSGDAVWPGGPMLALDRHKRSLFMMGAEPVRPNSPEVIWGLVSGPYTILRLGESGGFLFKSATLLRALGYKGEIPAEAEVDVPVLSDRADSVYGYFTGVMREPWDQGGAGGR